MQPQALSQQQKTQAALRAPASASVQLQVDAPTLAPATELDAKDLAKNGYRAFDQKVVIALDGGNTFDVLLGSKSTEIKKAFISPQFPSGGFSHVYKLETLDANGSVVDRSLIRYRAGLPTEVTSVFKNGLLLHEKIDLAPMHRMPYVRLMSDEDRREFNQIDASMQLAIPLSPKKAMFIPVENPSKETKIGPAESFTFSDPHFIDGRRAITFSALGKDGFVIEETDIVYRNGLPFQMIQKVKGGKKVAPTPTELPTP